MQASEQQKECNQLVFRMPLMMNVSKTKAVSSDTTTYKVLSQINTGRINHKYGNVEKLAIHAVNKMGSGFIVLFVKRKYTSMTMVSMTTVSKRLIKNSDSYSIAYL